ncbi:MAG: VWA domain-containing protein [Rhodovarius sp.]|nr:VWA domain-containing protein [Rhodovarius sp.]MCX7931561.1 VWA domain-containing protein [Rhodovarius sp.]MDW8314869.1 VWA domain-containing protein [Rhodovarius sp.]
MGAPAPGRALPGNLAAFARLLRRAGLPVGPGETLAGLAALSRIDIGDRTQVQAALRAVMVHRHEHAELFDAAFAIFWRDPAAGRMAAAAALLDGLSPPEKPRPGSRRLAEALKGDSPPPGQEMPPEPPRIDAALTASERERLMAMDFEAMSAAELAAAREEIRRLVLPLDERRTRRWRPDPRGRRLDVRASLRRSLRTGGELLSLVRSRPRLRPPPLVAICDISGSMARYAQVLLHFLHALSNHRERVHCFLFGTRLTNVTRQLRHRDAEVALEMVGRLVPDWSGGTRIGEAIATFNRRWARRVLAQGAIVLLITDGLDRDGAAGLSAAMERLHRSSRRLIWLNPLLRYAGFEPKSQGIRAMLPHVDEFRPVHNLHSLRELVSALAAGRQERGGGAGDGRIRRRR